jgi:TIR domain
MPEETHPAKTAKVAKRDTTALDVSLGPVLISRGKHRGRIGYYDDDDHNGAIIYFGDFLLVDGYHIIPYRSIRYATLDTLLKRHEEIQMQLTWANHGSNLDMDERYSLLAELHYIDGVVSERMFFARYGEPIEQGRKLFISHSSKDKWFVRRVADDLKKLGHDVWIDEHRIKVGQLIPQAIQRGIDQADFVIIFLSPNSAFSNWVEVEWVTKFMSEVEVGKVQVLPALIEPCEIPPLPKAKKYADFTKNYDAALTGLLEAIA